MRYFDGAVPELSGEELGVVVVVVESVSVFVVVVFLCFFFFGVDEL